MPDYDAIIKAVENDKPLPKNVIDIPDVKESHTSYINCMQELNERIAQLTELVNTGTETLESLKKTLKTVEEERDRLAEEREPKFERVEIGEPYFYVFLNDSGAFIVKETESNELLDRELYKTNNYFHTKERAQKVADKINFLLKLERLHDIYFPNYFPNWNDCYEEKFSIYYDTHKEKYAIQPYTIMKYEASVYFPTLEIAQKVCDILNAELEEKV